MGASVTYDYRGNGTRHSRTQGSDTTYYHYAAGFGVTNEENGTDVRTYIGGAHFDGSSSSLGTASYYTTDHLGSTRGLYDGNEDAIGQREYTPYGMSYHDELGSGVTRGFTGHDTDSLTGNHFAPFRYLDPSAGRWLKRDPLGMINGPNMYAYVGGNPVNFYDPLGLAQWSEGPSGGEPTGHLSYNIGDPFGQYDSFSFGITRLSIYGYVYKDVDKGGKIVKYLATTPEEDLISRQILEAMVRTNQSSLYGPTNCRTFSKDILKRNMDAFGLNPIEPPKRSRAKRPWWRKLQDWTIGLFYPTTSSTSS